MGIMGDEDGVPVVLVGGFHDGHETTIPDNRPEWRMPVPLSTGTFDLAAPPSLLPPLPLVYQRQHDPTGYPSRRDDGRLVYRLAGS